MRPDQRNIILGNLSEEESNRIAISRNMIDSICYSVMVEPEDFNPDNAISVINDYIGSSDKLPRLLYSEITQIVYSIEDPSDRENYIGNLRKLADYALDIDNNVAQEAQNIILRLMDHSDLAFRQIDAIQDDFTKQIAETKDTLTDNFKGIEKEYISILGIFAAIIMAFVGGMTFSTSVLNNIRDVSIYRLITVACIIGIVFFDMIWLMIDLIRTINGHIIRKKWMLILFNSIMGIIIILTIIAYKIRFI